MTLEALTALALFAFVSSITPGPNNLMLMTSGAHFGIRRTLPHLAGVALGFMAMLAILGAGLGQVLERFPLLATVLQGLCLGYLALLVWKVATAPPPGVADARRRPMTFLEAAAFQWINPKGWAMALTTLSAYVPDSAAADHLASLAIAVILFGIVNVSSVGTWALAGTRLRALLDDGARGRAFNLVMAALLGVSILPLLAP